MTRSKRKSTKPTKRKDRALQEIKKFQSHTSTLMPRAPFARLVREILRYHGSSLRVTKEFLECLHEACEIFMTTYFEDLNFLAIHARRVTIMDRDINCLRGLKRSEPNCPLNSRH